MRILTIRPPWSNLIINHGKDVENRVRNIAGSYRGPVAIHAGLRPMPAGDRAWHAASAAGMDTDRYDGEELHVGHIIGVVDLVAVHHAATCLNPVDVADDSTWKWCSPWAENDVQHVVLANPRPLDEPIPYRGALGLRHLDDNTTARILAQIGAS